MVTCFDRKGHVANTSVKEGGVMDKKWTVICPPGQRWASSSVSDVAHSFTDGSQFHSLKMWSACKDNTPGDWLEWSETDMKLRHSGAIISIQGQNNVKAQPGRIVDLGTASAVIQRSAKELHRKSCETLSLQEQASRSEWQTCLKPYEMQDLMKRGSKGRWKSKEEKQSSTSWLFFLFHVRTKAVSREGSDCRVSYKSSFLNHKFKSSGLSGEKWCLCQVEVYTFLIKKDQIFL